MQSDLELHPGTWTVGGGAADGIRFPGLPSRLVELDLDEDRVWVCCTEPRQVGRALLPAGVRRWLLPGERIRLSRQASLWVEPVLEAPATVALVRALLSAGAAPGLSAAPLLACVVGPDAGSVFPLVGGAPEIGRLQGCTVRLGDGAVSRRHLQLLREGAAHRLRDLGGRNRARCNGRWLRAGRGLLLADGDLLGVGRSLLHYRASRDAPVSPPHQGDACGAAQGRSASLLSPPHQGDACGAAQGRSASLLSASETAQPAPPGAPSDAGAG